MPESDVFRGKVVSVWVRDPAKGCFLENVQVQQLANRAFLVGQVPLQGRSPDPRAGCTFWFPLDDVLMLTVYDTAEEAWNAWEAQRNKGESQNVPLPRMLLSIIVRFVLVLGVIAFSAQFVARGRPLSEFKLWIFAAMTAFAFVYWLTIGRQHIKYDIQYALRRKIKLNDYQLWAIISVIVCLSGFSFWVFMP